MVGRTRQQIKEGLEELVRDKGMEMLLDCLAESVEETEASEAILRAARREPEHETFTKLAAGLRNVLEEYKDRYPEWCGKCAKDGTCGFCLS